MGEDNSYVHGTLYHDLTFEGVLKLHNSTFYLEAVDRRKPWPKDQSILYEKDDVADYARDLINFPDLNLNQNFSNFKPFSQLYRKYLSPGYDRNSHTRYVFPSLQIPTHFFHPWDILRIYQSGTSFRIILTNKWILCVCKKDGLESCSMFEIIYGLPLCCNWLTVVLPVFKCSVAWALLVDFTKPGPRLLEWRNK